jgi:hypothetical protein
MPLTVLVDGVAMPEAEARAFWERFSAHMDANKGDLAGFAHAEGFASVHPEMHGGGPVLVVSRTAAQATYRNAPQRGPGSGSGSQKPHPRGGPQPTKPRKNKHRR